MRLTPNALTLCLTLFLGPHRPLAVDVYVTLTVRSTFLSLDGVVTEVIAVDGCVPGPTVEMMKGDRLLLTLVNGLGEAAVAVHCHGFRNGNNSWNDGVGHMTQCPLASGQSQVYVLPSTGEVGTFWWHEHNIVLRAYGLYGAIVICDHADPILQQFAYVGEEVLLDLWHANWAPTYSRLLQSVDRWAWVGDPQSLLLNGKGCYGIQNASLGFNFTMVKRCHGNALATAAGQISDPTVGSLYMWDVTAGAVYRLRLIGATALSIVTFAIQDHNLTVVEADGHSVVPYNVSTLEINSGQRYSVIVRPQPGANASAFWIVVVCQFRSPVATAGLMRLTGTPAAAATSASTLPDESDLQRTLRLCLRLPTMAWRNVNLFDPVRDGPLLETFIHSQAMEGSTPEEMATFGPVPRRPTRTLYLVTQQAAVTGDGVSCTRWDPTTAPVVRSVPNRCPPNQSTWLVWTINDTAFRPPATPILLTAAAHKPVPTQNLFEVSLGDMVDIILQNGPAINNLSEQHPWHLHGHHFWVLGQGVGTYDFNAPPEVNLNNPLLRDTVTALPHTWTHLRFTADNPGAWLFHCHVDWHTTMGMVWVFLIQPSDIPPPPATTAFCGDISILDFPSATTNGASDPLRVTALVLAVLTGAAFASWAVFGGLLASGYVRLTRTETVARPAALQSELQQQDRPLADGAL